MLLLQLWPFDADVAAAALQFIRAAVATVASQFFSDVVAAVASQSPVLIWKTWFRRFFGLLWQLLLRGASVFVFCGNRDFTVLHCCCGSWGFAAFNADVDTVALQFFSDDMAVVVLLLFSETCNCELELLSVLFLAAK